MPPITAAATIVTNRLPPMEASKEPVPRPRNTPQIPHSAPETSQATVRTRSADTPQPRHSSTSSAVARIASPNRVYRSSRCTASMTTAAQPMMTSCRSLITTAPRWYCRLCATV